MTPIGPQVFTPSDPGFADRVRASFARQRVMATIGAELSAVSPGEVVIELPFRDDLTQQHGYLHAAIVTAIVDSACGYAAHTLMPADEPSRSPREPSTRSPTRVRSLSRG